MGISVKQKVLIITSYVAEMDEIPHTVDWHSEMNEKLHNPLDKRFPRAMKITDKIHAAREKISVVIDCPKCNSCGSWVTQKPSDTTELHTIEFVGEKAYCSECVMVERDRATWKYEKNIFPDGSSGSELFGVNIFEYEWRDTGKKIHVKDPLYKRHYEIVIWKVEISGVEHEFAAGEFGNEIWGAYLPKT